MQVSQSDDEQIIEDENEDGEQVLCDGCIEPIISPPFYHCAECRYFLHLPCAELPHELQHPSHPHHPLTLTRQPRFYDHFHCDYCNRYSNGFFFCCTSEDCYFYLDLKCSALPKIVEHETHDHPLFERTRISVHCSGCSLYIWEDKGFGCDSCEFYLHPNCLLLPKTMKNRYDSKHPLTLRYPPHSYHPRPFDCYECEEEINPNYWLYHCEECDLSFHVRCINPSSEYSNCKYGQKLHITSHPHPLKYVYQPSVESSCHGCLGTINLNVVECETCNFHLCNRCVRKFEALEGQTEEISEPVL